jgi:hypothetical protein
LRRSSKFGTLRLLMDSADAPGRAARAFCD